MSGVMFDKILGRIREGGDEGGGGGGGSLKGRRYSIIGDSISTYEGYVPEGYVAFYPTNTEVLGGVENTWWKAMERLTGMKLLRNCSWSGQGMCGPSGVASGAEAGCSTSRIADLADGTTKPDVVIIYTGINDFNDTPKIGSMLGTWTHADALPAEGNQLEFCKAYALGVAKAMTAYPDAEVYCCSLLEVTNPAVDKDGVDAFPVTNANGNTIGDYNAAIESVAKALGAGFIDLHSCGISYFNAPRMLVDGIHPNASGMERMGRHIASRIMEASRFVHGTDFDKRTLLQGITDAQYAAQDTMINWSGALLVADKFAALQGVQGRPIYGIRLRPGTVGRLFCVKARFRSDTEFDSSAGYADVATVNIDAADLGTAKTFMFDAPVTLAADEKLVFGIGVPQVSDGARFYYGAGNHEVCLATSVERWTATAYKSGIDYVV